MLQGRRMEWNWIGFVAGVLVGTALLWVAAAVALRTPPPDERW